MERSGFKSYFCSKEGNGVNKVVMLNSFQDLHRLKSASGEEIPDQARDDNRRRAFTLIELLVVVLIIGILSAVAVPQYQKAVTKSDYAKLKPLLESIYQARQVHYLETGSYGTVPEDLSVSLSGTMEIQGNAWIFAWGGCTIESEYTYCKKGDIAYYKLNTGRRSCIRYANTKATKALCEAETGKSSNSEDSQFYWY